MRIHRRPEPRAASSPFRRRALPVAGALAALAIAIGLVAATARLHQGLEGRVSRLGGSPADATLFRLLSKGAPRALRSLLQESPLETITLDVKFKDWEKIRSTRDAALARGLHVREEGDEVPAGLRFRGRSMRAKIRLKGDWVDHLLGRKWSLRIKMSGDGHVDGLRSFSVQAPYTRGFLTEPAFFEFLRSEGVLAPRYWFARVVVNGESSGIMAVEEHFSKELLESQSRREGPILRFDESLKWAGVAAGADVFTEEQAAIKPFRPASLESSPLLAAQAEQAQGLLEGFTRGRLAASHAFDVETTAKFLAASEVWSTGHGLAWHNLRFYYNPVLARLEPIAYDAHAERTPPDEPATGPLLVSARLPSHRFTRRLLEDPAIGRAFLAHLARYARMMEDGTIAARMREVEARDLAALRGEFPLLDPHDFSHEIARARRLLKLDARTFLGATGREEDFPEWIRATKADGPRGPALLLTNLLSVPVSVTGIVDPSGRPIRAEGLPVELAPGETGRRTGWPGAGDFRVTVKLPSGSERTAWVERASPALERPPLESRDGRALARDLPFLAWDAGSATLTIRPGRWTVRGIVSLPPGVRLKAGPGTVLGFGDDGLLIARGPVQFEGSKDRPVTLERPRIAVLQSGAPSSWKHVTARNGEPAKSGLWELTGSVTFYESEIAIESSRFEGSVAEDALNLIRSPFSLKAVEFRDAASDAVDVDFASGEISGGTFERIQGDGVDVSGADLVLRDSRFDSIRDKAVSVGEKSRARISGIHVAGSGTGVASKDLSETEITDSRFESVEHVALHAYAKKAEFGPGTITARGITVTGSGRESLAQTGSRIELDGRAVPTEDFDADATYATGYMRKK